MSLFDRYLSKTIALDESPLLIVRSSWVHYRWPIIWIIALIGTAAFLFYPAFQLGRFGVAAVLVLVICIVFLIARVVLVRTYSTWVVTNRRLFDIDQRGFFDRHVAELPLEHIEEIRYNTTGIVATISRTGTIIIVPRSGRGHLELHDVIQPATVKDRLAELYQHHTKTGLEEQDSVL